MAIFKKKEIKKPKTEKKEPKKPRVEKPKVEEKPKEEKKKDVAPKVKVDGRNFGNETISSVEDIELNGKDVKEIKTVEGQGYRHSAKELENIIEESK